MNINKGPLGAARLSEPSWWVQIKFNEKQNRFPCKFCPSFSFRTVYLHLKNERRKRKTEMWLVDRTWTNKWKTWNEKSHTYFRFCKFICRFLLIEINEEITLLCTWFITWINIFLLSLLFSSLLNGVYFKSHDTIQSKINDKAGYICL